MKHTPRKLQRAMLPFLLLLLSDILLLAQTGSSINPPATDEAPAQDPNSGVIVRVNGEELHVEDIASVLEAIHQGAMPQDRSKFDVDQMLFRLVNDTLLTQEARALGMDQELSLQRRRQGQRKPGGLRIRG